MSRMMPYLSAFRSSRPRTALGLQYSTRSTSKRFGTGGTESGSGIRHFVRTELRGLPWRGRAWRSVDWPC